MRVVSLEDKRSQALAAVDDGKLTWFHIRACLIAGIGFFTDAYDLFVGDHKNTVPVSTDTTLKAAAQIGTLFGQLFFGWLGDRLGRQKIYGIELMIIIISTIGSALASSAVRGATVFQILFFWRLFQGIGIGGDYPLSAIITSEFATTKRRGSMIAAVFAMQGFGILAASIVGLVVVVAFKSSIQEDLMMLDWCWRLCVGLGAVPGMIAIYFRFTMEETPHYKAVQERDKLRKEEKQLRKQQQQLAVENGKPHYLVGEETELTEIKKQGSKQHLHMDESAIESSSEVPSEVEEANDTEYYFRESTKAKRRASIRSARSRTSHRSGKAHSVASTKSNNAVGNIIINLMGTVPGYWFTVFLVEKMGRIRIQKMGFAILTILFVVLGFAYNPLKEKSIAVFIVIFTLAQFFQNFGPNATTFILPGEVFPTRWRSTSHGISAASGKAGAIVSSLGFFQLKDHGGKNAFVPHLIKIFAVFMAVGFGFTYLIPETAGKTLEEIAPEDSDDDE
ncbi:MFS general substrate transporter [Ramicandelaber brevisporus]|nr:MFS general substrate transporter [Ramicandelaber brevisporus]